MEQQLRDVNVLWTPDLTVGSASLDEHNREMFEQLGTIEEVIASASPEALAIWLTEVTDQLSWLLAAEEEELAGIGYPELAFHRQLHDRARARIEASRIQLAKKPDAFMLSTLARDTCAALSIWLMRHVQDADKLFFPYIDPRYRDT